MSVLRRPPRSLVSREHILPPRPALQRRGKVPRVLLLAFLPSALPGAVMAGGNCVLRGGRSGKVVPLWDSCEAPPLHLLRSAVTVSQALCFTGTDHSAARDHVSC